MNRATKWIGALGGLVLTGAMTAPATAAGTLTVDPNVTQVTTINIGNANTFGSGNERADSMASTYAFYDAEGGVSRLADATLCLRVTSETEDLKLVLKSYTEPADVNIEIDPAQAPLFYAQGRRANVHAPTSGWRALISSTVSDTADDTSDPGRTRIDRRNVGKVPVCLTAEQPGTYMVQFVDAGSQGATDDDTLSAPISITVLDAFPKTVVATGDDWKPSITSAPAPVGVGKALTTKVDLTGLTLVDARGTSSSVGVLNTLLSKLVGVKWGSTVYGDALAGELSRAGAAPGRVNYGIVKDAAGRTAGGGQVNEVGARVIPASTEGIDTIRSIGTIAASGVLDRDGNGLDNYDALIHDGNTAAQKTITTTPVVANVPGVVTLSASPTTCTGACVVTLSGTAEGASQVTIAGYGSGITANVNPTTGAFTATQKVTRTATFQASTGSGSSDPAKVTVKSVVTKWSAKAGKGKVTVKVSGGPRGGGLCYVKVSGKATVTKQASGSTGSAGTGTCTVTVSGVKKGNRTVKVGYDSPRASISGWTSTKTVKVS